MDIISEFENGDVIACIDGNDKPLYTAAPDLLAALTDAYQYMVEYKKCQNQGLLDDMQAAITKAKGN